MSLAAYWNVCYTSTDLNFPPVSQVGSGKATLLKNGKHCRYSKSWLRIRMQKNNQTQNQDYGIPCYNLTPIFIFHITFAQYSRSRPTFIFQESCCGQSLSFTSLFPKNISRRKCNVVTVSRTVEVEVHQCNVKSWHHLKQNSLDVLKLQTNQTTHCQTFGKNLYQQMLTPCVTK